MPAGEIVTRYAGYLFEEPHGIPELTRFQETFREYKVDIYVGLH